MHLHLLVEAAPNPFFPGMWRSPEDDSSLGYRSLDYWRAIVTTAERGRFASVIFETTDTVPRFEPLMLLSALAASSRHIGLVASPTAAQLPVGVLAEHLSSLDHLSDGRIGWRIDGAAKGAVFDAIALWEDCWDDHAMAFDTRSNTMVRDGATRSVGAGFLPVEPSPQRTPTLFGRAADPTAIATAEVIVLDAEVDADVSAVVEATLDAVDAADRSFDEVALLVDATIAVGADEAQVTRIRRHIDRQVGDGTSDALVFCGTPGQVATQMRPWLDAGVGGFALRTTPLPGGVTLLADVLVPELQEQLGYPAAYASSTLREHCFGRGNAHLSGDHPAQSPARRS